MSESLLSSLPYNKNWRYRPYDYTSFTLAPNDTRKLIDLRSRGWVLCGSVLLDNPDVTCLVELETETEIISQEFSTNDLMAGGLVQSSANYWWISLYNNIIPMYCVNFTPANWWAFYRKLLISLKNETALVATIVRTAILAIEFVSEPVIVSAGGGTS